MSEYIKMNDTQVYNYQKDIIEEKDKEIERLTENNQAMQAEMARTWKKNDELHSIIKEVRELANKKIKGYEEIINTLIYSCAENKRGEIAELKYRIGEQEELLEILDKESE